MVTTSPDRTTIEKEYATRKGVALFSRDIDDIERIRAHYDLDNFSQALRRAIKLAVAKIDDEADAAA